jgi:hypothetical protein
VAAAVVSGSTHNSVGSITGQRNSSLVSSRSAAHVVTAHDTSPLRKVESVDASLHAERLFHSSWTVGEQLLHATLIKLGDVRPSAVEPPFQFVSLT